MLEKVKRWKVEIGKYSFVLVTTEGLVNRVQGKQVFKKIDICLGWNIYSVMRYLLQNFKVKAIYRYKGGEWRKVSKKKIHQISCKPMEAR